jgi:hypothetical protein
MSNDTPPTCVNCGQPITDNAIRNRWGAYHLDERHCLAAALHRAEADAAALRARVAELEGENKTVLTWGLMTESPKWWGSYILYDPAKFPHLFFATYHVEKDMWIHNHMIAPTHWIKWPQEIDN